MSHHDTLKIPRHISGIDSEHVHAVIQRCVNLAHDRGKAKDAKAVANVANTVLEHKPHQTNLTIELSDTSYLHTRVLRLKVTEESRKVLEAEIVLHGHNRHGDRSHAIVKTFVDGGWTKKIHAA